MCADQTYQMGGEALHAIVSQASQLLGGSRITLAQFQTATTPYAGPQRTFHGMDHVKQMAFMTEGEREKFAKDIGNEAAASRLGNIVSMGGFYHDTVYTQVDGSVTGPIAKILEKYVVKSDADVYSLRQSVEPQNQQAFDIVTKVFGLQPGAALPSPAKQPLQNEFLSALVAADHMHEQGHTNASIAQVTTVIEGTIPFRGKDHFYALAQRLNETNKALSLNLSEAEIDHTIKATVFEANKDVLGFAGNHVATDLGRFQEFIRGTWRFLPETNSRYHGTEYTAEDYRRTIQGNHFFFTKVLADPTKQIFHEYKGYPAPLEYAQLNAHAVEVRGASDVYLKAKTASAALVEAIAAEAGVTNSTLLDLVNGSANYLPVTANGVERALGERAVREEARIALDVLKRGRGDNPGFDISPSPIGAHLLEKLGEDGVSRLFDLAGQRLKAGETNYNAFLSGAKTVMGEAEFGTIADTLAKIATSRDHGDRGVRMQDLKTTIAADPSVQALPGINRAHQAAKAVVAGLGG